MYSQGRFSFEQSLVGIEAKIGAKKEISPFSF